MASEKQRAAAQRNVKKAQAREAMIISADPNAAIELYGREASLRLSRSHAPA